MIPQRWSPLLILLSLLVQVQLVRAQEDPEQDLFLKVDPRLIAEADEVLSVIASHDNPLWPGWDATRTPILFYLPGQQDVLINHPDPPEGFVLYEGLAHLTHGRIHLRNGPTLIDLDGQNTSREIQGIETLVVADTLSNLKTQMAALMNDPRPVSEKLVDHDYRALSTDPYGQMAMIAHEAFHVFQSEAAPGKGGDERSLAIYPTLSVINNVGFAFEGNALAKAILSPDEARCREAAIRWLAVRLDRRSHLPDEAIAYEDGTEFMEGLAKYVEYKLSLALEEREPADAMLWVQGFHGYGDLESFRQGLIDEMLENMHGRVNVNNDPYGTAPLRFRLYYSGMAIALVLDRLCPDWHGKALAPDATLTGLARAAIKAAPKELALAHAEVKASPEFKSLQRDKSQLEEAGRKEIAGRLDRILHGNNTLIILDYSAYESPEIALGFTPFGISAVDEHRTIYGMVPISARIEPGVGFYQTEASPLLHDRQNKLFQFQLAEKITRSDLERALGVTQLPERPIRKNELNLPGLQLISKRMRIAWEEGIVTIRLL